ncbi:MAG: MBL fold metallo-hydrolase, partial [Pseudomonadota bacterium]
MRGIVEAVTALPVVVINTHTHTDHIGGNRQFEEIAMFDHERSRRTAEKGVSHEFMRELIA